MNIKLVRATFDDCQELYTLQIKAFKPLLDKYQDFSTNPGAEPFERTVQRFNESITQFWFISLDGKNIGALRICDFGDLCKLKQIYILPEHQGNGYAQKTIRLIENMYPNAVRWELDTILQEDRLCYLYEKMGYRKTGKIKNIKDGMDNVFYAKDCK